MLNKTDLNTRELPKDGETLSRDLTLEVRNYDEKQRTVEVAFSSETEIDRGFGKEVLSHDAKSVRLDRLNSGAAVLVEHDSRDQVGAVLSARIDGDRVGRAILKFSKSARGSEVFEDVRDGIRKMISVGYRVYKWSVDYQTNSDVVRALDWEPHEISFVAVPHDASVGVGRSLDEPNQPQSNEVIPTMPDKKPETGTSPAIETRNQPNQGTAPAADPKPTVDVEQVTRQARADEVTRINQIRAMAEAHDAEELGRQATEEGWTYDKFNRSVLDLIGTRNNEARATSRKTGNPDLSRRDREKFSLLRVMHALGNPNDRAAQEGARHEFEVSEAGAAKFGSDFSVRGCFVPPEVLGGYEGQRALSAGTATDGAELVAQDLLAESYIEVLRNAMVVRQAGATFLPGLVGNVDIPRQTAGASSTWITAEDGDATEGEPQFDQVQMSPKDLAAYTEVTRRLLQQSTPAIEGIVRRDLAVAQALGIDSAALYGSGASGQPEGISNVTGINAFNFAAAGPTYPETVRMVKEVILDNALMGSLAYIIDPSGWEDAMTTEKATNTAQFIMSDDRINGYQSYVTAQVTAEDWFFGNWSDLLVAEWGGLEINVDPYTHSLKGKIRFITFKSCDLGVRHPVSFCFCNDGV